jgi:hypothetical protein
MRRRAGVPERKIILQMVNSEGLGEKIPYRRTFFMNSSVIYRREKDDVTTE